MNKFSELAALVAERIASRNNPTGLTANDVGAYSAAEMNATYNELIPVDTLGIAQVGDQSYFPLAIDGSADGALAMTDRRTYGICREVDGSAVILRSATNSINNGVYYAICKTDNTGKILSAVGTSRAYKPSALPKIPQSIYTHNAGVLIGVAMDANNANPQIFCSLTNGTFDVSKHISCLVAGDLTYADLGIMSRGSAFIYNNSVYYIAWGTAAGGAHQLIMYSCPVSSFVNGGTVTFTRVKGISGNILEGTQYTNSDAIKLWDNLIANTAPANLLSGIPYRAAMRVFAVVKGNIVRILFGSAWYTNSKSGQSREGLSNFYIDFNLSTKVCTWNPGAGQASYVERDDGIVIIGPSTKVRTDADYNDGYWQMGAGNFTGNMDIRSDGLVTCCVNDNLASPMVLSYRITGFASDVFTELGKLVPQNGYSQSSGWISIADRVVGATAAHGFISFMSKVKVWLLSRTPGAQGNFEGRIITNQWDTTYPYKNSLIDVTGFPPSNNVAIIGDVGALPVFATIHMDNDTSVNTGSILTESRTNSKVDVSPDTFAFSGPDIAIVYAELIRAATMCWDAYTGSKITYDKIRGSICVPPASTGAPCLMFVSAYNSVTQQHGILVSEVNVSGRSGVITVTSVVSAVAYNVQTPVLGTSTMNNAWGSLSYRKCSDGWLVAGAIPIRQNTAGNANDFQIRAGKKSDGSWVNVELSYHYTYLAQADFRWTIHPVWGIGYVDMAVANQLSQGGSIFNGLGVTVADYVANTVKTSYMVCTVIAAAGFNLYVNEPIPVMMAGSSYIMGTQRLNLLDIDSNAGNSTWYISVVLNNGVVSLSASKTKQPDNPDRLVNIGSLTTSATQISTMSLVKTTMLLSKVIG